MNRLVYGVSRSSAPVKKAAVVLCAVMALLAASLPLFSQAAVGTILGGVFDSSGGAIAGAKVTIIDVARGTTRTLTTDAAGEYTAPSLLSGTYTVRAAAKGFQTVQNTPTCCSRWPRTFASILRCRPVSKPRPSRSARKPRRSTPRTLPSAEP